MAAAERARQRAGADRFIDNPVGIRDRLRAVIEAVQERQVSDPALEEILKRAV